MLSLNFIFLLLQYLRRQLYLTSPRQIQLLTNRYFPRHHTRHHRRMGQRRMPRIPPLEARLHRRAPR